MRNFSIPLTASKIFATIVIGGSFVFANQVSGQSNLVVNPGFTDGTTGWSTQCSIEINPETVYGGIESSNPVSEIDVERCFNQEISISAGAMYNFSYKASRRQGSTPETVGVTVTITGVQSGIQYVHANRTYTNTTWIYTTENFSFTPPINTIDTRVNIQFENYTTSGTYGTLVDDITLSIDPQSSVLPVRMVSFHAKIQSNKAKLDWVAMNDDQDGNYFVVERSGSLGSFDSIGRVQVRPSGNAYSFTDAHILSGTNNYRLRSVSTKGGFTYSNIVSLDNKTNPAYSVYPNPATHSIVYTLSSASQTLSRVRVFSISGSLLLSKQAQLSAGNNTLKLDITSLQSGSFYLRVSNNNGINHVQSFCKR